MISLTLAGQMPRKVKPGSDFGERLMALRKAKGLTQVDLAARIGSSQRALSRYETIADYPPASVVIALARALDVTTDELFGLAPKPNHKTSDDSPELRRLWRKFQHVLALPEKDRRAVIRLVNSLLANRADINHRSKTHAKAS